MTTRRVDPKVRKALEETGLPWSVEDGGSHQKLRIAGRFVGVLPFNGKSEASRRGLLNSITHIRRVAKEIKG